MFLKGIIMKVMPCILPDFALSFKGTAAETKTVYYPLKSSMLNPGNILGRNDN